ncbi:MAG TPA: polyprenol monophosphomannose synthase [Candidatus Dormibacteraeota bacterium]|nr:polyprenol monophosphomannose synthase [Candidatus Dormibacteraeota bacterium]
MLRKEPAFWAVVIFVGTRLASGAQRDPSTTTFGGAWNRFPTKPRTIVILPTYNEADNLPLLVTAIRDAEPEIDILVVDDNSPDGTGRIADELASRHTGITVFHRPIKQGLGRAYVAGFAYALSAGYECIVEMDADFSHAPADLPRLLEMAQRVPVVIGSRAVPGGRAEGWSPLRSFISKAGSVYARRILGLPLRDVTSGFKCFRRSALELVDLDRLVSNGYAFQIELNHACHRAGLPFLEIPIVFRDRVRGRSKMTPGIAIEAAWLVLGLRIGFAPPLLAPVQAIRALLEIEQEMATDDSLAPSSQTATG